MFSQNSAFSLLTKAQDKANPKPEPSATSNDRAQDPGPSKSKNITIKSTSIAGISQDTKKGETQPVTSGTANLPQQQENRVHGGGKLQSNRVQSGEAGNISLPTEASKQKEEEPLSTYYRLKDQFFMYSKFRNNTLVKEDAQKIIKTFQLLTSSIEDRSTAEQSLKTAQGRAQLIKITFLYNDVDKVKAQANHYLSLIILQLMSQSQYLSFEGAHQLVNQYLKVNKDVFYVKEKFNLDLIYKECNIKILNELSSGNLKNEAYFKKMVKEINFIKDIIFLEYDNFFKMLKAYYNKEETSIPKNKFLDDPKFLKCIGIAVWNTFKNLVKSQKKAIENFFELKIMFTSLQSILRLSPNIYDEKIVMKQILPIFIDNFRLIEVSERLNYDHRLKFVNVTDEFILHLMLVHPFNSGTCSKPVEFLSENGITRFNYLLFFDEKSLVHEQQFSSYRMKTAETALFIETIIAQDEDFSCYEAIQDEFIFQSICNILRDNPQRFWKEPQLYRNIRLYINDIENRVQRFADQWYGENFQYSQQYEDCYLQVCRFAQLLNLLCFSDQSHCLQKFQKLLQNRYLINDFLKVAFQRIVVDDKEGSQTDISGKIEHVYEFFHRLINFDPEFYLNKKNSVLQDFQGVVLQQKLFGNYLMRYAENGISTQACILAFSKLIQKQRHTQVKIIMDHLTQIDLQTLQSENKESISMLQYIVKSLFTRSANFIPLAKNILCILKHCQRYTHHPWMDRLENEFKELPETMHPENNAEFALILEVCLKLFQNNSNFMINVQKIFDFKFASKYLSYILEISYSEQDGAVFNKKMRGAVYKPINTAVRLLKAMTSLYLKEKDTKEGEMVPYEIRKLLQSQNKDGDYQITMKNSSLSHHAISYHLALIAILVSRELTFDSDLKLLYPNLKNEILQTLINLNRINLQLKHENILKVTVFYDKQLQGRVNRRINLKTEVYEAIIKDPSYLGLEYLISSGTIDFKQKKSMFERIRQIQLERSFSNMRIKSHFVLVYWREIQNSKLNIDFSKGWQYVKREISQIQNFLRNYQYIENLTSQQREEVDEILKNSYILSQLLKNSGKDYYVKFFLKNHNLFFDLRLNNLQFISGSHQNSLENYRTSLLQFFNCKSFISSILFEEIAKQYEMHQHLYSFLCELLLITHKKDYNLQNDVRILEIIEYGLVFLIQLNNSNTVNWFQQIRSLFVGRPQRHSPMLTKQIIILVLLSSILKEKLQPEHVQFGNRDWLLLMGAVQPNARYSSILISQMFNIYEMHSIFFTNACHYLVETAKTCHLEHIYEVNSYRIQRNTVSTLIDILKKSIQSEKSYYSVWIIEILIEIFMNNKIGKHERERFCSDIRKGVLTLYILHERIAELLSKIGCYYSLDYANLWKNCSTPNKTQTKQILFSEKQELLAYLRLLTLIYFMDKSEKTNLPLSQQQQQVCIEVEEKILLSVLQLFPLVEKLLKDEKGEKIAESEWEKKLKNIDLSKMQGKSMLNSGIRQLQSDKISEVWKDKNGLDILHEISNIELASICTMWISKIKEDLQQIDRIFLNNLENLETYFERFFKFLDVLKVKLTFLKEGNNEVKGILQFLKVRVYGSIVVSKDLLFTNMSSLSSSLTINEDEIKDRLVKGFMFIYCLIKKIQEISSIRKIKNDQIFKKMFDRLLRSCKHIKHFFIDYEPLFEIPDNESNRSQMSYTRSRTINSQK